MDLSHSCCAVLIPPQSLRPLIEELSLSYIFLHYVQYPMPCYFYVTTSFSVQYFDDIHWPWCKLFVESRQASSLEYKSLETCREHLGFEFSRSMKIAKTPPFAK